MWRKIYFTFFFVFVFATQLLGQSAVDSIKHTIANSTGDQKSQALMQLSYALAKTQPDTVLPLITSAIDAAETPETKGKICLERAFFYHYLEKNEAQLNSLDEAYQLLQGVNDSIAADALYYKEMLLGNLGRYKEALQVGHQELALRKKLPSKDKQLNALLQIGYTYDRMGEYQKAIEWYQKGLKIKGVKNLDYIGRNYGLIGIAYDELEDYNRAVAYNLKAIEYFEQNPNSDFLHAWYSNIGNTYIKLGELELAEKYTLLALEDKQSSRYVTQVNLGKIYLEQGKIDLAEKTLLKALQGIEKTRQANYHAEVFFRLHELYRQKNDFEKALFYFEAYKNKEDERFSVEKAKQLNELTIQYETAEKEKQILQQEAKLSSRNFWIFGLLALAIIVGLLGFLFYKQQLLKNEKQQKVNALRLAEEKHQNKTKLEEQRLSISRDLHDNIGAQLSFIVSAIDTIKYYITDKNEPLNQKIDHVGWFAKETIQELRDTIWAMNKSGISTKDLQGRIANFIEKAKQSQRKVEITVFSDESSLANTDFTAIQGLNIFRIVQEAINNALKHAQANEVKINIENDANCVLITIEDNGIGFDSNLVQAGNGLYNMQKRADELESKLTMKTAPNSGTKICLRVPKKYSLNDTNSDN